MDAAGELPRQARHTPSTRVRPLSLTGAPQGRPSTRRRPSAEPGAPARPPSGSDPRDLRFAEGRIARVGGGAKLSRRCRSSSGLRAPPLRAAAASAAATSGSLCCGRPRGPWLNAGVSFWVRYLWSPAGPGPPVALEVRGRLSAAPYMYVREVCVRLSLGGTPAVSLGCLSITAQGTPPPKQKAFRLWIAPRSRRDPRAVLAPVLGARRREHAGSASHRDGVPPLAPRALRAVHELGRYLPQSRHGMSMGCRAGQRWPRGARGRRDGQPQAEQPHRLHRLRVHHGHGPAGRGARVRGGRWRGVLGAALRTRPSLQALGERATAEAKALVNGSRPIGRGSQCPASGNTGEGGGSIVRRRTWG